MTVVLTNGNTGLFDLLGKVCKTIDVLNTGRGTDVPATITSYITKYQDVSTSVSNLDVQTLLSALASWQGAGTTLATAAASTAAQLLIDLVTADSGDPGWNVATALEYVISQMQTASAYVTPNTVSVAVAANSGNTGDIQLIATTIDPDVVPEQEIFAETLDVTISNAAARASLLVSAKPAAKPLTQDWPAGSGIRATLTAIDSSSATLVKNGGFDAASLPNIPDNWLAISGTPGTSLIVTSPPIQTVAISRTPTGGYFLLKWQNAAGITRSTSAIPFSATASVVQSALRAIPGLESVAVAASGTSPNLTYTITMWGVPGVPNQLTSQNSLSSLSIPAPLIVHTPVAAGSIGSFKGTALQFVGCGDWPVLYQALPQVTDGNVYVVNFWARRTPDANGTLVIDIMDGIGGSVTYDPLYGSNRLTLQVSDLSASSHEPHSFMFRLQPTFSQPVYLRVQGAGIDTGESVWVDELSISAATQLYPGGPYVAAFMGTKPAMHADSWTITTTNNRAGKWQDWFARLFNTPVLGLALPITGTTLISDSLIA